jgi:hypothetical protein
MNKVSPDPCWWCGVPADSREHKFKRRDLIREHGQAPYVRGATLGGVGAVDLSRCAAARTTR